MPQDKADNTLEILITLLKTGLDEKIVPRSEGYKFVLFFIILTAITGIYNIIFLLRVTDGLLCLIIAAAFYYLCYIYRKRKLLKTIKNMSPEELTTLSNAAQVLLVRGEKWSIVNVDNLKLQFKGNPFNLLIKQHLKKLKDPQKFMEAIFGTTQILSLSAQSLTESFIDRWNERVYDKEFWRKDTSDVFSEIIEDARSALSSVNAPTDDETLFNMFQIVVLSYAYSASTQPKMQKFIGIK